MVPRAQRLAKRAGDATGGIIQTFADAVGAARRPKNAGKDLMVVSSEFLNAAKNDTALSNPSSLIATHGFEKIEEMECEETIHAVEQALFKTRLRTAWGIDPGGNSPADKKLAAEVEWTLRNMQGTLRHDLLEIWSAHSYGFSVTHKKIVASGTPFGQRWVYERLRTVKPNSITFKCDAFGNLQSILQTVEGEAVPYEPADFIVYSWDKRFADPNGRTAYRTIYRSYFSKLWNIKFWNQYLERKAGGIIVLELPPTYDAARDGDKASGVLHSLQSDSEVKLPDGWRLRIEEPSGGGDQAYAQAVKTHNFFMATGLLAPEHLGYTETDGGSYAKADVQSDLWLGVCEDLGRETAEAVMDEQVIRPYVLMNNPGFAGDLPTFRFDPLVEDDKWELIAKLIDAMRAGGVALLDWTLEDQDWLREAFNLPELPKDIRKLREDEQKTLSLPPEPKDETEDEDDEGGDPSGGQGGDGGGDPEGEPPQTFADFPVHVFADKRTRRPLTRHERVITFAERRDRWDKVDESAVEAIETAVHAMRDDLLANTGKVVGEGKNKPDRARIKNLKLKGMGDIRRAMHAALLISHLSGKADIRAEYQNALGEPLTFAETYAEIGALYLIPAEARRYFKGLPLAGAQAAEIGEKAFWITDVLSKDILKEAQAVLYKGLAKGDPAWTRKALRDVFDKYLETGRLQEGALSSPWRVETIVRTNLADAYNQGRQALLRDKAVDSVVEAYQYTAILDDNTTDYCEARDGLVFDKDDIDPPPAHFNCRSFLVPVFRGETFELSVDGDVRGTRAATFADAVCGEDEG